MSAIETLKAKYWCDAATIIKHTPIGVLRHAPTGYTIAVYKPIPRFQRLMLRWCFGLKYEKL